MIDTVKMFAPHRIRWKPSRDWEVQMKRTCDHDFKGNECYRETQIFLHKLTGLRAWGSAGEIQWIEASLPRVLFGSNGRLISDDNQLQDALCKVRQIVRQIATPLTYHEYFNRVDLVWQFRGNPADFFAAHQHMRHRRVRRETCCYDGQSINWPGSGFRVRMYDKMKEMLGVSDGDVVRVEVQISGRRLKSELGNIPVESEDHQELPDAVDESFNHGGIQVTELDFSRCYEVYRRILLGFKPAPLADVEGIDQLLAIMEREGWKYRGVRLFDLWARKKHPRYVRSKRAKVGKIMLTMSAIDWSQLLPEDQVPPVVEVVKDPETA